MNIKSKIYRIFAAAALFAPLLGAVSTHAATSLEVSPAKTIINANPGEHKQVTIIVKNPGSATPVNVLFNNFASVGESGEPQIIQDDSYPQGLKSWLSGAGSLSLSTGGSASYVANIAVPSATKPGTYYGLVQFAPAAKNDSTVSASVGSLILINVGTVTQLAALESFDASGIIPNPDQTNAVSGTFKVRIKNTGTGFVAPQIKIEVLDSHNGVVDTLDANKTLGGVLPGRIRLYSVEYANKTLDLSKTYHARVTLTVGTSKPTTLEQALNITTVSPGPAPQTPPPATPVKVKSSNNNLIPILAAVAALLVCGITVFFVSKSRHKSLATPPPPTQPPLVPSNTQSTDQVDIDQDSTPPPN